MFNKYYIFNEDTDNKLKELGFELNKDTLTYEMVCYDCNRIIAYTVNDKSAGVQRIYPTGVHSKIFKTDIYRFYNFEEIKSSLKYMLEQLVCNN
jgi:hypothetical protein